MSSDFSVRRLNTCTQAHADINNRIAAHELIDTVIHAVEEHTTNKPVCNIMKYRKILSTEYVRTHIQA